MEDITLLFLGLIIVVVGVFNIKGNISSIHWYNRRKVSESDVSKYGKAVGTGTVIIGCSLVLNAVLVMLFHREFLYGISIVGCVVGLVFILYGQFKYNKGLF